MLDVKKVIGVIKELERALQFNGSAPLFNLGRAGCEQRSTKVEKDIIALLKESQKYLPFQRFRFYAYDEDMPCHGIVETTDNAVNIYIQLKNTLVSVSFELLTNEDNGMRAHVVKTVQGHSGVCKIFPGSQEFIAAIEIAMSFILKCCVVGSHLVEVTPNTKACNKAMMQWVKANTYYEVVHRRHAANNKDVKEGQVVKEELITRVAHARRAHMRILRAARYGSNQGKVLYIKNTWVGPKEWKDAESRQIYRIVK